MAMSFDCFLDALAPFATKPDEWVQPDRLIAKACASRFSLRSSEFDAFNEWWKLNKAAMTFAAAAKDGDIDILEAEVRNAFTRLRDVLENNPRTEPGYRHVRRVPGKGGFVIFSDLHMGSAGSRQDFFHTSGNHDAYAEILSQYAEAGFTLVENGDVEELLIREPDASLADDELELLAKVGDQTKLSDDGWPALDELRRKHRLEELSRVIDHHASLYRQINSDFVERGRYVRLAGNHDQDNQDPRFLDRLQNVYPTLDKVYDFLVIEPAESGGSAFIVCHGHHFDLGCTPKYAARIGETHSESLGWTTQGADRVWRWDGHDGVQRWTTGDEPFANTLVTDDADAIDFQFGDAVKAGLLAGLGSVVGGLVGLGALGGVAGLATALSDELSDPGFWESVFTHNIAWDYFKSSDRGEAVLNEVMCGKRWFKFRHLDEIAMDAELERVFDAKPPCLVLGHSHEPRHRALNRTTSKQLQNYMNSGAAGRFENLIWCVEIVDGVAAGGRLAPAGRSPLQHRARAAHLHARCRPERGPAGAVAGGRAAADRRQHRAELADAGAARGALRGVKKRHPQPGRLPSPM